MMNKERKQNVVLEIMPTVFPDLNKQLNQTDDHETVEIAVQRMKHKHIRVMQSMSEDKQMHYILSELTGLSSRDLDELDAEDSAALTEVILGYIKKFAKLAQKMSA